MAAIGLQIHTGGEKELRDFDASFQPVPAMYIFVYGQCQIDVPNDMDNL